MAKTRTEIQAKYDSVHSLIFTIKLNREADADIITRLEHEKSRQGYIKQCIRQAIQAEKHAEK